MVIQEDIQIRLSVFLSFFLLILILVESKTVTLEQDGNFKVQLGLIVEESLAKYDTTLKGIGCVGILCHDVVIDQSQFPNPSVLTGLFCDDATTAFASLFALILALF